VSFDLKAVFNLDGRPFERALKNSERSVEKTSEKMSGYLESAFSGNIGSKLFGAAFKSAGIAAVGVMVEQFVDKFQDKIKEVRIGSIRTGLDMETFQRVQNVTEATGSSAETAAKAMEHIAIAQEKIRKGEPEAEKLLGLFSEFGITMADIESKRYDQLFFKWAEAMRVANLDGAKLAATHELLGKSGAELIPAAKKGFDSLGASGGMVTEEDVKNADGVKKSLEESNFIWKEMGLNAGRLGSAILDSFKGVAIVTRDIANGDFFKGFTKAGREELEQRATEKREMEERMREQAEVIAERDAERSKEQLAERLQAQKVAKEKEKAAEGLGKLEETLAEKRRRNRLDAMSPAERKAELQRQLQAAETEARNAAGTFDLVNGKYVQDPRMMKRALEASLRAEDLRHELLGIHEEKGKSSPFLHDSLAAIGGFTGNAGNNSERALTNIERHTRETAQALKPGPGSALP
jgi:hypothetical protein